MLFGIFCTIGCLAVKTASAQLAWTPEQKAVWKTETTMDDLFMKKDYQDAWAYIDDSYMGWRNDLVVLRTKDTRIALTKYLISQGGKVDFDETVPIAIWVNRNYAYADYYYHEIWENKEGVRTRDHGRWMDVFMKKGDKWMLVGDHGRSDLGPPK